MEARRSLFTRLSLRDKPRLDLAAFIGGKVDLDTDVRVVARSPLGPSRLELVREELVTLLQLSASRWSPWSESVGPAGESGLRRLADGGLVLCRGEGTPENLERLRQREELLLENQWSQQAAQFHFDTGLDQEQDAELIDDLDFEALVKTSSEDAIAFVEKHGPPPPTFPPPRKGGEVSLPTAGDDGELFDLLHQRRTHRKFDRTRSLRRQDLATLLRWVFAPVAYHHLAPGVDLLRRSSPSGGSLHPFEAYPLVIDVEGLECGLYHYASDRHTLESVLPLEEEAARQLAIEMGKKQLYVGEAHCLVILAARWSRNFWKYQRNSHTYSVVLMDAGHLSQTFYLVATHLGLGAFFTGAVHRSKMAQTLGVEQIVEGPIGICGCGPISSPDAGLPLLPFEPGSTKL